MQQTFPAGKEPKVIIAQVKGDLTVQGWDRNRRQSRWTCG